MNARAPLSYKSWRESADVKKRFPTIPGYIIAEQLERGLNPAAERENLLRAVFEQEHPGLLKLQGFEQTVEADIEKLQGLHAKTIIETTTKSPSNGRFKKQEI